MSLFARMLGRNRTRLSCSMCGISDLQVLLDQVFDRPVDTGPRLYRLSSGQLVQDSGPRDVVLEVWWTHGQPVDQDAIIDEAEWFDWLRRRGELEHRRGLFLTDVPIDPDLDGRFGVGTNVLAVRPGQASYVLVSYADDPPDGVRVARLETAAEYLAV